jgi:uncharacterized protein (TIGR00270 family)
MCGKETYLVQADVEGVELQVCKGCAKYGKVKKRSFDKKSPFIKRRFEARGRVEFKVVSNYASLIRSARENKGMKQEDFSKMLNERESLISKWENSSLKPSIDTARKIGKILGVYLLEREGTAEKKEDDGGVLRTHSNELTLGDFIKVRKRK